MLKTLKKFIHKLAFIIKSIYKTGPETLFLTAISVLVSGLSPVVTVYSTSGLISLFEKNSVISMFDPNVICFTALIILSVVANLSMDNVKYMVSEIAEYKLSYNIESDIADKFQSISQKEMDNPDFLDFYKNATNQVGYAPINMVSSLFGIISSVLGLFGYITILFSLSVWLIPFMVVFATPVFYLKYTIQVKDFDFYENNTRYFRKKGYIYSLISERQYAKEIRLYNAFEFLKNKRNKIFANLIGKRSGILRTNIIYTAIIGFCIVFGMACFELWLIDNLIKNNIPISKFLLYNNAFVALTIGLFSFIEQIVFNSRSMLFLDYLIDFLNYKVDRSLSSAKTIPINTKDDFFIQFDNVSFRYPGSEKFSIKNVNLKLKKGDKICLVGENGSGKTTLIKLLLNIYQPTSGRILLNGINVKEYDPYDYQKLFAAVFQDFIRYFFDVKTNIGIGNTSKIDELEYMNRVSQITDSKKFIENYSEGYNTKVSKEFYYDAVEPSVGQWQKLAISRAVFKNAPFLILDEPTASLDPKSEEEIFKIFDKIGKEKTVLIISHRMYSSRLAQKIILLQKGEILEIGNHEELMNKRGKYYNLYSLQAKKYANNNDIKLGK